MFTFYCVVPSIYQYYVFVPSIIISIIGVDGADEDYYRWGVMVLTMVVVF